MKIQDVFRFVPGGSGVSGATVTLKRHSDDSTITTATTDANGLWAITRDMNPGPCYWEATDGYTTRRGSSKAYGMAGPLPLYELVYVLQALGGGVVKGALNEFVVTAGSGRVANIASGVALIKGIPVVAYNQQTVTLDAADASNPRIDTVVIEVTPAGQTEEGKSEIKLVKGTAAASPVAPTLTQTNTLYQYALADVRINAGSSSITSVTSRINSVLLAGTLTRNPTAMGGSTLSTVSDTTITSTSGQDVASLTSTVTLEAGVVYDIVVRGWLLVKGTGTDIGLQAYLYGSSNAGSSILTAATTEYIGLPVYTSATLTGSGSPIACGLLVRKITSGGTAVYRSGYVLIQAIPRS